VDLTIAFLVLAVAALAAVVVLAIVEHRRSVARASRRRTLFTEVAARIDAAVSSLGERPVVRSPAVTAAGRPTADPSPLVVSGLTGRAGLLQELTVGVAGVRSQGERLAAAVVRAEEDDVTSLAHEAGSVAEVPVFAVGPRAVALVLPGLGRADALGVLAQIAARCPSSGRAVELEPDEDAVELAARLLGGQAPHGA